jgi:DNA mismatch endonuclease (patch repair protein)
MSAIKSKDTTPEIMLRKELWRRGMRFRKNMTGLPGKPDIVFTRARVAVFCDGDFWHGNNWAVRGYGSFEEEMARYSTYWSNKIEKNVERDLCNTKKLEELGWMVIRLWESDIKKNLTECADKVQSAYMEKREGA